MSHNERLVYKKTELFRLRLKEAESKARMHCVRLTQEKGGEHKLTEFYEER